MGEVGCRVQGFKGGLGLKGLTAKDLGKGFGDWTLYFLGFGVCSVRLRSGFTAKIRGLGGKAFRIWRFQFIIELFLVLAVLLPGLG